MTPAIGVVFVAHSRGIVALAYIDRDLVSQAHKDIHPFPRPRRTNFPKYPFFSKNERGEGGQGRWFYFIIS